MIKNFSKLLLLCALTLASCSQGADEPAGGCTLPDAGETTTVTMALSRAAADEFQAAGISSIKILTYKVERTGSELVSNQDVTITGDNVEFPSTFPLGENYRVVALANVRTLTGESTYETLTLGLDPLAMDDVWMSSATTFSSDKSTSRVILTLRRIVARLNFVPSETEADLQAQTDFDRMDVTYHNVGSQYLVSKSAAIASDVTVSADVANGFKSTIHTFETTGLGENATLGLEYYKNGEKVNESPSDLETATTFTAGRNYNLMVQITNADYQATPWARSIVAPAAVSVFESDF